MAPPTVRRKQPVKKPKVKRAVRVLTPRQVAAAIEKMAGPSGTARFAAGKALAVTAAKHPARIYPQFDAIAAMLDSDSKIVCWNAMQIINSLAAVDQEHKIDATLDRYFAFIRGVTLISAGNAVRGLGQIARARPDLLDRVIPAVLGVEGATYETPECRNVVIGHALDALRELWPAVRQRPDVTTFVRRQRANTRAAVARRAEKLAADLP